MVAIVLGAVDRTSWDALLSARKEREEKTRWSTQLYTFTSTLNCASSGLLTVRRVVALLRPTNNL